MPPDMLGDIIQFTRVQRYKLREFARILNVSATHLSDIENNRRIPSESLLLEIAQHLGLDVNQLMVATRRVSEDTRRYAEEVPQAVSLFRKISNRELSPDELKVLERATDRLVKKRQKTSEGISGHKR